MISTGWRRTAPVAGVYWMTSASSSRSTTAPGVTARSVPTWNAPRSVWDGMPPLERTSRHHWRAPRATLSPPVSNARLSAAGVLGRKVVGAGALITVLAQPARVKRPLERRRVAREEVGRRGRAHHDVGHEPGPLGVLPAPLAVIEVVDQMPGRFAQAQVLLAQPAERRVLRPRRIGEAPVALGGPPVGLPGQDAQAVPGPPARPPRGAPRLGQRHADALQQQGRGGNADRLAGLDDAERLVLVTGRSSRAHIRSSRGQALPRRQIRQRECNSHTQTPVTLRLKGYHLGLMS